MAGRRRVQLAVLSTAANRELPIEASPTWAGMLLASSRRSVRSGKVEPPEIRFHREGLFGGERKIGH